MNTNRFIRTAGGGLAAAAIALLASATVSAQVKTQETVAPGASTQNVTVERGEVVWVSGNNLMVKQEDGALRYFPDVPDTARAMVAGKELSIHDLKPGMKLERTTIVTTTPKTIRTVRTVTGTVWQVSPPNSVILTLADKTNQRFTIPKNQKFTVDGKETDAFGLRPGMRIAASAVSERQETSVDQSVKTTGVAPPPPPPQAALLIIESAPTPAPATVAQAAPELPRTASPVPLIGVLGLLCCGASLAIRRLRRS
jgi:hypothetical protein